MKYGKLSFLVLAATGLAATAALCAPAPLLLAQDEYDPARLLPPPPADDTPAAKAELAELKRMEAARSDTALARARSDDKTENASIFEEAIGPGFHLEMLPATTKLLGEVRREESHAAAAAKSFFKRNRPWIVDPSMASCSKLDAPQSSYPSGHATMGYAMAVVLAKLVPERAQAVLARASDYAENRLVCGMHFRRDIEAGQTLGTAIAVELLQNAQFKMDYSVADAELRAAHFTGP